MANSNEYMREYMLKRYHVRRAAAIAKLGGMCVDCKTTEQLEFDHADAKTKSFNISKIWNYSQAKLDLELAKCVLRCKSCHLLKTRKHDAGAVEHGGGLSGKRNCKCELCRKRKAEWTKEYRRV